MKTYLVGFSAIHDKGNHTARAFKTADGIVTEYTVRNWEKEILNSYNGALKGAVIQVFTFKQLGR